MRLEQSRCTVTTGEYALLLVFLSLAAIAIIPTLGNTVNAVFSRANSALVPGAGGS